LICNWYAAGKLFVYTNLKLKRRNVNSADALLQLELAPIVMQVVMQLVMQLLCSKRLRHPCVHA